MFGVLVLGHLHIQMRYLENETLNMKFICVLYTLFTHRPKVILHVISVMVLCKKHSLCSTLNHRKEKVPFSQPPIYSIIHFICTHNFGSWSILQFQMWKTQPVCYNGQSKAYNSHVFIKGRPMVFSGAYSQVTA